MLFVGYPKCSTSNKAQAWLDANNIAYEFRHIKDDRPTVEELRSWYSMSGLPLKRFFNTSGKLYKEMNLKEKLSTLSEDEQLKLLSTDGMLVKRPLLIGDGFVLAGFKETEWKEKLKEAAPAEKTSAEETPMEEVPVKESPMEETQSENIIPSASERDGREIPDHLYSTRRSIAFIGSECHPFVKTGGLGDVMYALPRALAKLN